MNVRLSADSPVARFKLHELDALEHVFDREAIIAAVRQSFLDHHAGRFVQPQPTHMTFGRGDCHIKSGYAQDGATFMIKVATGFYDNEAVGLANSNGLMLVSSQNTGAPLALLQDRGMLTAWRTAAATIVAALAVPSSVPLRVGIVGAGLQARLAAEWLPREVPVEVIRLWSRSERKRIAVSRQTGAEPAADLEALCRTSNLIITATPSATPLVMADWVAPGTHVVAIGADTPGKVEIDPRLFARASLILTDSHEQCLDHGDFGVAVRAGAVGADADVELGCFLSGEIARPTRNDVTIADLTGLAIQDDAIARLFLERLEP